MDKKAKDILFKTFWKNGWIDARDIRITDEDFDYAKSKGLMFDPIEFTANEFKDVCEKLMANISVKSLSAAFLAGFSKNNAFLRSALASYVNLKDALAVKKNTKLFRKISKKEDLNILNFERLKWGGVRHRDVLYNYLDLKLFLSEEVATPDDKDVILFKNILNTIQSAQKKDTARNLSDNLKNVWPVSKEERDGLLEVLGCCGILETLDFERPEPARHDWDFVTFWRGEDKFNKQKIAEYFGEYKILNKY